MSESLTRHQKITESLKQGNNITKITIPSFHIADSVVVYEVDVSNKKLRWNLWLRYEFFFVLHQMLLNLVNDMSTPESPIALPPFPEKRMKFFTNHLDEYFVENRRLLLENYLQKILQNRFLKHSEVFINFLTPPENEEPDSKNDQTVISNGTSTACKINDTTTDNKRNNITNVDNDNESKSSNVNDNINNNNNNNNMDENNHRDMSPPHQSANGSPTSQKNQQNGKPVIQYNIKDEHCTDINEDDEITAVYVPQAQILKNDHVIYHLHIFNANQRKSFQEWTVLKRFDEFNRFDNEFREAIITNFPDQLNKIPPLPPKYLKVIVDHLDDVFVEKRRLLLQGYLQKLIRYPTFRRHELVSKFLGVYSE